MEVKKGCLGYLFSFLTMFVLTLVLAGEMKQVQAENCTEHVYDYECDNFCNVCGAFRVADHDYVTYGGNANIHWRECDCGYVSNGSLHWYEDDSDTDCNECGYVRELKHSFDSIKYDELFHWKECDCGLQEKKELHTYVNGTCKICNNMKPDWYDESAHRRKDGVEYLSLKEAAVYCKNQLVNRNIWMEVNYYIDSEKVFQLGESQKILYEEICQHTGVPTEGDLLWDLWVGQYSEEDSFDGKIHFISVYNWMHNYGTSFEQEQKLSEEIAKILKELKIDTLSDYDKIYAIYKYICDHVAYSHETAWYQSDSYNQMITSAYGALMNGYAVCDGYADLVYRMMLEAGIDTRIIENYAHAWNIVKLDGIYYCLDATWDAPSSEYWNFLLGLSEFTCNSDSDYHIGGSQYRSEEFLNKYPVSDVAYGKTISQTDEVIESGSSDGVHWSLTGTGVLTISGNGVISEQIGTWRYWQGFVKKIVIEEGITAIGKKAFAAHSALEEVVLPKSVTEIGDMAFWACDSLYSINLTNNLKSIGKEAFRNCNGLIEVVIPDSVTFLGEGAFRECFFLEKVTLSKGISVLSRETFYDCSSLRTVVFHEGLKEIGDSVFERCSALENIVFPESLQKIGNCAFKEAFHWKKKVSVTIPEKVNEVGEFCFSTSNVYEIIWKASAETVKNEAFYYCYQLENVILGDSVKEISNRAFCDCISLKTLTLSGQLEQIGTEAFMFCKSLSEVIIPGSMNDVGAHAFYRCENLASIILKDGVKCIGKFAFAECPVETLTVPASVSRLGEFAFGWCNRLKKVYFDGEPPRIPSGDMTPFQDVHGSMYYYGGKGNWTTEIKNRLTNDGSVLWIDRTAEQEHKHAFNQSFDNNNHWKECTCGDVISVAPHIYATEQSTVCEVCGYERTVAAEHKHVYLPAYDKESHWKECECGEIINQNFHVYLDSDSAQCLSCDYSRTGDQTLEEMPWIYDEFTHWKEYEDGSYVLYGPHEFTYEQDPDCNICGYIREVEHKHKNVFSYDEESHFMECETCGERSNVTPHAFKSDCTAKCNACKFTREASEHQYNIIAHNDEKHWMECACGLKTEQEEHVWKESKIGNVIMYECEYCDAEKEEYESSDDLLDSSEETSKEPSVPSYTDEPSGGNNMVIIISVLAAVLLLGGIGFAVVIKKKNKN